MKIKIHCFFCGKVSKKEKGEINRRIKKGNNHFFCSRSCSCKYGNLLRKDLRVEVEKECPECHKKFKTMSGAKSPTFCSRSCASKGSMTLKRRMAQRKAGIKSIKNLLSVDESLKRREAWKYKKLKSFF